MKLSSILASSALFVLSSSAPIPDKHQHPAPNVVVAPTLAPELDMRQTVAPTINVAPNAAPNAAPNTAPAVPRRQAGGPLVNIAPAVIIAPTVNNAPNTAPTTSVF